MPPRPPESRCILLDGQTVDYRLRRSTRRTIGLTVDRRGLTVGAPLRATLGEIEALLRHHGGWVIDKLARHARQPPSPPLAGRTFFVLDFPLTVEVTVARHAGATFDKSCLRLAVPPDSTAEAVLEHALREYARPYLAGRVAHFAARLGVPTPPMALSAARTRWGSCSSAGQLRLHWRLILLPPAVVDYVVCHELAHLKEMNHGPRFWAWVETLCPDWRARRAELRHLGPRLPVF